MVVRCYSYVLLFVVTPWLCAEKKERNSGGVGMGGTGSSVTTVDRFSYRFLLQAPTCRRSPLQGICPAVQLPHLIQS